MTVLLRGRGVLAAEKPRATGRQSPCVSRCWAFLCSRASSSHGSAARFHAQLSGGDGAEHRARVDAASALLGGWDNHLLISVASLDTLYPYDRPLRAKSSHTAD
jgi:hypothetical protein